MSPVLVDTHALLWFVFDDPRISERAASILADRDITKVLSVASLWEIAIKVSIDRLRLGMSFEQFLSKEIEARDLVILAIRNRHLVATTKLPLHHRDPFDRLLIAQASAEAMPVVTSDPRFAAYDAIEVVW